MADLVLLNETLSIEEMKDYVACRERPSRVQPLIYFDNTLSMWELKGPSLTYNLTKEDVCRKRFLDSLVMFPHQMEKEQATQWCLKVGGHLPVPQNHEDNGDLASLGSGYINECSNSWSSVAWLGVTRNLSTGILETDQKSTLHWNNFRESQITENLTCASVGLPVINGSWFWSPCDEKTCVVCHYTKTSLFRLRGNCKKTKFDYDFFIKSVAGKVPLYVGYFQSRILLRNGIWRLEATTEDSKSYAEMNDDPLTNPLGRHLWYINSSECGEYQVRNLC